MPARKAAALSAATSGQRSGMRRRHVVHADQQDERVHRQQIASEQSAAEDREGDPVCQQETPIALSAGRAMGMRVLVAATGISIAATVQATGTNMFMCVVRCSRRCQRQSAMRYASRFAVAL